LFGAGCATLLTAGFAAFLHAQNSTTAGAAALGVASIKPNKTDAQVKEAMPPGRYIATNITLRFMIQTAYEKSPMNMGLALFEFEGGPDWIRSERFDVNAKASSNVPVQQIRLMLQNLLADRFHLRVHYETRQAPMYRLGREIVMPPPPPSMPNPYTEQTLPSIFSVLPDQLGLKLESQRGPVQILVIDSADHPTPN